MNFYKVTFEKRPNIERYPDNPPSELIYFTESETKPNESDLVSWFYKNIGSANSYKIKVVIETISEDDYNITPKHNRIFL
jgi:hypothetical protein